MTISRWPPGGSGSGGSLYWGDAVATAGDLPIPGAAVGEIRLAIDTGIIYIWNGLAWIPYLDPSAPILRANIEPGTPDYVLINAPVTGLMSEEAQLDPVRGGLGTDATGFTGYVKAVAGVFSAGPIAAADLPSGIDASDISSGVVDNAMFDRVAGLGRYESTSTILGGVLTINADPTKFDLSLGEGVIIDYSVDPHEPTFTDVAWPTSTAVTVTNLASNDNTYILINAAGAIVQQSTFPTPDQMRDMIYIGMLLHVNRTSINFIRSNGNHAESIGSHMMDFWNSVGPFNIVGNTIGPNGVNMTFAKSAGLMFSAFYNQTVNPKNPHEIPIGQQAPASFGYRTMTGGFDADTTLIDPNFYDVLGVKTLNTGAATTATVQRVYLLPTGDLRIQWGQFVYTSLAVALSNMGQEPFVTAPAVKGFGILIGYIALQKGTTSLNNLNQARVFSAGRFEIGPAAGALASTTWQQAYENSVPPVLVLDGTVGPAAIYDNPTPIGTDLFSVSDFAGTTKYIQVDTEGIKSSQITPSTALVSDPNGAIVSLPGVSATEVSYLGSVTSDIQGQLNAKADIAGGLDQFAPGSTTSLELQAVMSDETGGGPAALLVFNESPLLKSPTIDQSAVYKEITTPVNPLATFRKQYPKADGHWFSLDSTGGEFQTSRLRPVVVTSGPVAATRGTHYLTDTTSAAFTVNLPAGTAGASVKFTDATEKWGVNNLTIAPSAGEKIDTLAIDETLVCDVVRGWVELNWTGPGGFWAFNSLASTQVGEASATSPGIVSTGAQSFAGPKTFLGGITGKTDGVAIAVGMIGEKITWVTPPANQSLTTTEADWTNGIITLSAGIWLVQANLMVAIQTPAASLSATYAVVKITDSSNVIVQNMDKQMYLQNPGTSQGLIIGSIPFSFVANINGSTTYKIRVTRFDSGGIGNSTIYNGTSAARSEFFGVRIA